MTSLPACTVPYEAAFMLGISGTVYYKGVLEVQVFVSQSAILALLPASTPRLASCSETKPETLEMRF